MASHTTDMSCFIDRYGRQRKNMKWDDYYFPPLRRWKKTAFGYFFKSEDGNRFSIEKIKPFQWRGWLLLPKSGTARPLTNPISRHDHVLYEMRKLPEFQKLPKNN